MQEEWNGAPSSRQAPREGVVEGRGIGGQWGGPGTNSGRFDKIEASCSQILQLRSKSSKFTPLNTEAKTPSDPIPRAGPKHASPLFRLTGCTHGCCLAWFICSASKSCFKARSSLTSVASLAIVASWVVILLVISLTWSYRRPRKMS